MCRAAYAREGSAAMGTTTAVSVDDDFATCHARVAVRASDDEFARRVHVKLHVITEKLAQADGELPLYSRDEDVAHVGLNLLLHKPFAGELVMLRADDNGVNAERFPAFAVFDRHL